MFISQATDFGSPDTVPVQKIQINRDQASSPWVTA